MSNLKYFKATVLFQGYDNEELRVSGLPPLDQRIRECIETHPVASFRIDSVQVEEVEIICRHCGSPNVEERGESGEFWLYCHSCGKDDA